MPRLALALDLAPRTTARVGWGRYAQPQGLHELQSTDGVSQIGRAEVAEQRVMGLHHRSREAITTRVELYERRLLRVAPRWVSVDNSIDVFPEIEPGRVLLTPSSGRARGVEVMASRPEGQRITWSASYALARADDRVDGRIVRRPLDQRHTVALDAGWRPTASWQVSAAWLFHSGWPTTAFAFTFDTLRNGMVFTDRVFGARNVAELPAYHRLDLRASRTITRGATRVALFVDLFNAYDRRNARGYDVAITRDGPEARFGQRVDALIPRLPSFGVSWEF